MYVLWCLPVSVPLSHIQLEKTVCMSTFSNPIQVDESQYGLGSYLNLYH